MSALERILSLEKIKVVTGFDGTLVDFVPTEYESGLRRYDVRVTNGSSHTIVLFGYSGLDFLLPNLIGKDIRLNALVLRRNGTPIGLDQHIQHKGTEGEYDLRQQISYDGASSYTVSGIFRVSGGALDFKITYSFKINDEAAAVPLLVSAKG